jgi:RHS repeat-associated protein
MSRSRSVSIEENAMHRLWQLAALWLTLLAACSPARGGSDPRANARAITEVPEGTVFYLNDHHSTTVVVLDGHGEVIEERAQHAFGAERMLASASEPWSFVGNELDATDLGNFHARPYDARLGRFLAVDPEPLFNPGATSDPRAFLAYGYAAGDPVNQEDPSGRSIWTKLIKVGVKVWKTGNAAAAFADNVQDACTLFSANATPVDRVLAGVSLASELLPVSVGDAKDAGRLLGVLGDARKVEKKVDETIDTTKAARRNAHLAGKNHPKTGVPFDADGYPDFSSYRHPDVPDVRIQLTGSRATDEKLSNAAAGLADTPSGYTWHHHQDQGLMQLVDRKVHSKTGHDGGFSGK